MILWQVQLSSVFQYQIQFSLVLQVIDFVACFCLPDWIYEVACQSLNVTLLGINTSLITAISGTNFVTFSVSCAAGHVCPQKILASPPALTVSF